MATSPFSHPIEDKSDHDFSADTGSGSVTGSSNPTGEALMVHQNQNESKAVAYGKIIMVSLLLAVAVTASAVVYKYTDREQQSQFDVLFEGTAHQVESVFTLNAKKVFKAARSFANQMTSHATGAGTGWPYVTIPGWEALAVGVREQTGASNIMMAHIVSEEQRAEWEAYSEQHSDWVQESIDFNNTDKDVAVPSVMPYIWAANWPNRSEEPQPGYEYYAPLWQTSPIAMAQFTNMDYTNMDVLVRADFSHVYENVIQENSLVMGGIINLEEARGANPTSIMIAPVYAQTVSNPTVDMIVAFSTFSYFVEESTLTYLGVGDIHEHKYDDHEIVLSFPEFETEMECICTVSIYPSVDFVESFDSNNPLTYTVVVASIFIFTIAVFLMYDCLVERRQNKVMSTATRSTAIVSSLFPRGVAERLMDDQLKETAKKLKESEDGKAIADLFPSATVMFADIVGFTAWSSDREPQQVFELLEEIYSSFDKMAKKHKIFKVETIGDCYMAAAGLPEKRSDHALAMAIFARNCLQRFHVVIQSLEKQLGPSTGELGLRVGVHSGPVTAGVLRGDKARFQLFGDTVNTAARMESTGTPGKVQLSVETAKLIQGENRNDILLVPRSDQIEAKGKGKLQTFWLERAGNSTMNVVDPSRSTTSSSGSLSAAASQEVPAQETSVVFLREKDKKLMANTGSPADGGYQKAAVMRDGNTEEKAISDSKCVSTTEAQEVVVTRSADSEEKATSNKRVSAVGAQEAAFIRNRSPEAMGKSASKRVSAAEAQEAAFIRNGITRNERNLDTKRSTAQSLDKKRVSSASNTPRTRPSTVLHVDSFAIEAPDPAKKKKLEKIVQWTANMLEGHLQRVIAMRGGVNDAALDRATLPRLRHGGVRPLDEVVEIISLDTQQEKSYPADPSLIEIPQIVHEQLLDYVEKIAWSYHENPFHNFEHATHVAMSVSKLLSRVVSPDVCLGEDKANFIARNEELHAYTYGITSDPLAQFAVVFSALVHDADHPGVPNAVLVKEHTRGAVCYRNQSVAEQNSVDLAWKLLSQPCYNELRSCIYQTRDEMCRFRQVVVNAVMATDIVDKQLGAARKERWATAFDKNKRLHLEYKVDTLNRKATIVIEHMIQASDVAHTMQHWKVYIRWNERFFDECYQNYLAGRVDQDPSVNWYKGEIGFFDFYIIPLAKKLKECQVFGVSSDEYLEYAEVNRDEWKEKGEALVEGYLAKYQRKAS
eukprot:Nitzschia sp. Nitz4//scaffold47_size129522//37125//41121//NITZ4_003544-RA/size129522-augustus-gene-0.3-mRNA-1//1//CDS//3329552779//1016//frame0